MLSDARSRTRFGIVAMSCVVMLGALAFATSADAGGPATTTHLGPVLTYDENPSYTNGRDAGISVALPNGEALWVFGDTPTYLYLNGQWKLRFFIGGTSAARGPYSPGQVPAPMTEVVVGHPSSLENEPTQFIPAPTDIRLPDGSGRLCTADNGAVENGRWVTGAALLPDDTNVLITYAGMCVSSASSISAQSFGFMEYNWRLNTISVPPVDVFPPAANGTPLPRARIFGSPVVSNNQVTLFSETCCSPEDFHATTIPADVASLANPASYTSHAIPTLRPAVNSLLDANVGVYPGGEWRVVDLTDHVGNFEVFSAPTADGPWSLKTTGTLPGCATSPEACYSLVGHPELSTSNALVVSYYQPGFGPGVAGHPYPHPPINHVVLASIAIGPGPGRNPAPHPIRPPGRRGCRPQ